ncbi:hypothetical protein ALC57_11595 [Trachymyrmex cornetzi]|uniref:DUF8207 domain-containing protein n=1 Tax=Trachymyrmex cornetzi TaxID=471704 RepID=A0A151J295_9HYME|nr:hypothetical protein ALC57_11595 [Trachymyrmex cornetzi]
MEDVREREKIAREIEKTSESIRKKHRALKTGRIEEDMALKRRFKSIIKPLRQIVDSPGMRAIKKQSRDNDAASAPKREKKEEEEEKEGEEASETFERFATPRKFDDRSHDPVQPITSTPRTTIVPTIESLENVFETTDDSLATKVQNQLQTSEGRQALRAGLGPLGQQYVEAFLRGDKQKSDYVYGVYLHKDGLMFGNKRFDVDDADSIIIDNVRYAGTPGLYELIFKRIPDDALYTEDDMNKYKSMLLATNAHKHKHHSQGRLFSNRGYKYKHIIAPLMSMTPKKPNKKSGKGLPRAMTLNDNAIDYVHWDDPNELVDRLRLLDTLHRAGNNAHDNEMLSIIEELREAGLIIN